MWLKDLSVICSLSTWACKVKKNKQHNQYILSTCNILMYCNICMCSPSLNQIANTGIKTEQRNYWCCFAKSQVRSSPPISSHLKTHPIKVKQKSSKDWKCSTGNPAHNCQTEGDEQLGPKSQGATVSRDRRPAGKENNKKLKVNHFKNIYS